MGKLRHRGSQWTFKLISREESELMNSICSLLDSAGCLGNHCIKKKKVYVLIVCFPLLFNQKIIIEHPECGRQMLCVVGGWRMKCLWPEGICLLEGALRQARVRIQQGGAQFQEKV